jgi:hypothetical protein
VARAPLDAADEQRVMAASKRVCSSSGGSNMVA